jgi:hypothetical protein
MNPSLRLLPSRPHRPLPEPEWVEGCRMSMVGPLGVGSTLGKRIERSVWVFPEPAPTAHDFASWRAGH